MSETVCVYVCASVNCAHTSSGESLLGSSIVEESLCGVFTPQQVPHDQANLAAVILHVQVRAERRSGESKASRDIEEVGWGDATEQRSHHRIAFASRVWVEG